MIHQLLAALAFAALVVFPVLAWTVFGVLAVAVTAGSVYIVIRIARDHRLSFTAPASS